MRTEKTLKMDDAILVVMMALGRPTMAYEITDMLNQEKYTEYPDALRPRIMSRMLMLEKAQVISRVQHGWVLTPKAKSYTAPNRRKW